MMTSRRLTPETITRGPFGLGGFGAEGEVGAGFAFMAYEFSATVSFFASGTFSAGGAMLRSQT